MKQPFHTSLLLVLLLIAGQAYAAPFRLEGTVANLQDSACIVLNYPVFKNGKKYNTSLSAQVKEGKFLFQGNIEEVTEGALYCRDLLLTTIYMEPGNMQLNIDYKHPDRYTLAGTQTEKKRIALWQQTLPAKERKSEIYRIVLPALQQMGTLPPDDIRMDSIRTLVYSLSAEKENLTHRISRIELQFAATHANYRITPILLYSLAGNPNIDLDKVRHI